MRPRTACASCRKRQRKCDAKELGTACTYCKDRGLRCSLSMSTYDDSPPITEVWDEITTDIAGTSPTLEILPPQDVCIEVATLYFNYIHDPTQQIFHRPTFMTELVAGTVPQSILLCVIALGARFSSDNYFKGSDPRTRGITYARAAEALFRLNDVSLTTLRMAILLGTFYGTDGDPAPENLYYAVACRIGGLLKLPVLSEPSMFQRELSIRAWWSLVMADVWASNGASMPCLLHHRNDIPFPISEPAFLRMRDGSNVQPLFNTPDATASIVAETIKLNSILADVAQLNKRAVDQSLSNFDIQSATEVLAERLETWRKNLPSIFRDTPLNLAFHASAGTGGAFVALYLGYYHFAQLLYYRYLHLPNLPRDVVSPSVKEPQSFAEQCRINSTLLCEIVYRAYGTPGAEVYYSMVGHVLVIASTVQLHILLFSDRTEEVNAARRRLEQNFKILCHLQTLWRALDMSLGRFQAFHTACMRSKANPTIDFRLDKWMVRFLMEFAKPIDERPEDESENVTYPDTYAFYPSEDDVIHNDDSDFFDLRRFSVTNFGIEF